MNSLMIKTDISFRISRIANENSFPSSRFKLVCIVGSEIRIACTTKTFKLSQIRCSRIKF